MSDVRTPGLSGFELTRRAQLLNPQVRVVLMTAFDINKAEAETGLSSTKVDDFIANLARLKISEVVNKQLIEKGSKSSL